MLLLFNTSAFDVDDVDVELDVDVDDVNDVDDVDALNNVEDTGESRTATLSVKLNCVDDDVVASGDSDEFGDDDDCVDDGDKDDVDDDADFSLNAWLTFHSEIEKTYNNLFSSHTTQLTVWCKHKTATARAHDMRVLHRVVAQRHEAPLIRVELGWRR